ncbi:hypothetical protein K1719_005494 [Acacia pycnantha]|nr:hypothetical protein K1719_005494 [Acacia pycnantha]
MSPSRTPEGDDGVPYSFAVEYNGPPVAYDLPKAVPLSVEKIPVAAVVSQIDDEDIEYYAEEGVALFWGIEYYNDKLMHSDKDGVGYVTTEILLKKDLHSFTLSNGWAFPRRVYFNGEDCQMPLPDNFPALPNTTTRLSNSLLFFFSLLLTVLLHL